MHQWLVNWLNLSFTNQGHLLWFQVFEIIFYKLKSFIAFIKKSYIELKYTYFFSFKTLHLSGWIQTCKFLSASIKSILVSCPLGAIFLLGLGALKLFLLIHLWVKKLQVGRKFEKIIMSIGAKEYNCEA